MSLAALTVNPWALSDEVVEAWPSEHFYLVREAPSIEAPPWDHYRVRRVLPASTELWERILADPTQAFIGLEDAGMVGQPGRRLRLRFFSASRPPAQPWPAPIERLLVDYFEESLGRRRVEELTVL